MSDSDSNQCFGNECQITENEEAKQASSQTCEGCLRTYHDKCIEEHGLENHNLSDTGYTYFEDNDVFFCSIGCSITYLSWFLGQEQKLKHKIKDANQRLENYYDYQYNFVSPKLHKTNRSKF